LVPVPTLPVTAFIRTCRPRRKRFCEFGNRSHISHDFAFFFMSHFMPGKQHNRRFPEATMSHAFSIRRLRVSGCLAGLIEKIQSRRAIGVMSSHPACASGTAARALRRSIGTLISGSSPARVISTVTVSTASAPAASRMVLLSDYRTSGCWELLDCITMSARLDSMPWWTTS
jgi:hypothetical protein